MPSENQQGDSGQYTTEKRKLMDTKNDMTLRAILDGCESKDELMDWLGAANATSASTSIKEYCAERIRGVQE
jgi:hypothetical protein